MEHRAISWRQVEVDSLCADISVTRESRAGAKLQVRMHFSRVVDGPDKDLLLTFPCAYHFQWEEESFGLTDMPNQMPRLEHGHMPNWPQPLLLVEGSPLAARYADRRFSENDPDRGSVLHFLLMSLNDFVHVISLGEPDHEWVPGDA